MSIREVAKALLISIFLIGAGSLNLKAQAQESFEFSEESSENKVQGSESEGDDAEQKSEGEGWVEVEANPIELSATSGVYELIPYRERRSTWGTATSFSYSTFEPSNYTPNFYEAAYSDVYSGADLPLIELQLIVKYNMNFGSLGAEVGAGLFEVGASLSEEDKAQNIEASDLNLTLFRLGARLALDTLLPEPYIVPYVSGGAYIIKYKEELSSTSFNGTTQMAPYFAAGLEFQLNWMDKDAARIAYEDSGMENTFVFLEGRKLMKSSAAEDPDFETEIHLDGGLRVEF